MLRQVLPPTSTAVPEATAEPAVCCETLKSWFVKVTCTLTDGNSLHQGAVCLRPPSSEKAAFHASFPSQGNQYRGYSQTAARGWDSSTACWWQCRCSFLVRDDNKQSWQGRKRGHMIHLLVQVPKHGFVAPEIKQDSSLRLCKTCW